MRFDVVSLFPDMLRDVLRYGVIGRAVKRTLVDVRLWNPRDYAYDARKTVDDRLYGGGPGMLLMAPQVCAALRAAKRDRCDRFATVYLSAQGRRLNQDAIDGFAQLDGLVLLAGRYKGVDERVLELEVDEEWSLGDYVLSGGELAALAVIDAVSRQCPGTLSDEGSAQGDSFRHSLLDCPHYTRPALFEGLAAPEELLSGDHEAIRRWRLRQSLGRTLERRPDLLQNKQLTEEERQVLSEHAAAKNISLAGIINEKLDPRD